ncbi:MAG TPA: hypoxanthine phosphoribosyltransferase, partial [Puia sp.]|nr:hypoxanthine phosphoribosyltransferase [Puia sp.]
MSILRVHDKAFEPYLSAAAIDEKIGMIASKIDKDYEGKKPLFIAILNGAFMFASDLFKKITIESEISFIKLAS